MVGGLGGKWKRVRFRLDILVRITSLNSRIKSDIRT